MEGREVVVIEWEGLYALYCQRCNQVTEIIRYDDYLRCGRCNHRVAQIVDKDWAKALREGGVSVQ